MNTLSSLSLPSWARLHSQMTTCEQIALLHILATLRPQRAIEIGTYQGGSLQILAHFCKHVESIDIDPSIPNALSHRFSNVTFHVGSSFDRMPSALREAVHSHEPVDFVLIDGDHSTEGVRRDINALLSVPPACEMVVLMHDAFNPDCRSGIVSANWQLCPNVHEVEIDYIPGVYHQQAYDTAASRTMWGGFACALLKPQRRQGDLVISQRQQGLFEAVLKQSSHASARPSSFKRAQARARSLLTKLSR
jgi:23S rRNA U2552 (ribose-2'-O)-methylase RlmE/FtsJ